MAKRLSPYKKAIEYVEVVPADEVPGEEELSTSRINSLALSDLTKVKKLLRASVGDGYGTANADSAPTVIGFDPGIVVAEGDSWFDYLPGIDLLDWLTGDWGWDIRRFGHAGDLLKDMIHNTESGSKTSQIEKTIAKVKQYKPRVMLFSGGGNDVAGEYLDDYLEPVDSDRDPLNMEYAQVQMDRFRGYLEDLISKVAYACDHTHVFMHGYGYMPVDGRGVDLLVRGWTFVGPWLQPALLKNGVTDRAEQEAIIAELVDMYNDMLASVAKAHADRFSYVDLRGIITMDDWANELHLKSTAYRRCSAVIRRTVIETLDED